MSDLQLAPPPERSPLTSVILAIAILAVAVGALFYFIPRDTAKVTVTNSKIFAPTAQFAAATRKGHGMNVISGAAASTESDLYVVVTVHVENKFRFPVSIDGANATLTAGDGSSPDGSIVQRHDVDRLESIFPALTPMLPHPLGFGDEIAPNTSLDGQFILQFPGLDENAWKSKKSASVSVEMHNQPAQTAALP